MQFSYHLATVELLHKEIRLLAVINFRLEATSGLDAAHPKLMPEKCKNKTFCNKYQIIANAIYANPKRSTLN